MRLLRFQKAETRNDTSASSAQTTSAYFGYAKCKLLSVNYFDKLDKNQIKFSAYVGLIYQNKYSD